MAEQNQKTSPRARRKDSARLVWDTKPRRAPNPRDIEFQTAEIVIPNPQRDAGQFALKFPTGRLTDAELDKTQMNRLIWGDNLLAMQALLAQGYEGKVDLIYIDPPFDSKADYSIHIQVGNDEVTKEPSIIERLAYKDTWEGGTDSYLDMLYPRLQLMKRLLSDQGSIYVHLDWHVGHYVKLMMDEIFGRERFTNEIAWCYSQGGRPDIGYPHKHDTILFYRKTDAMYFSGQAIRIPFELISSKSSSSFTKIDENGRRYKEIYGPGKKKLYRYYEDEGKVPFDWWTDIPKMTGRTAASKEGEYLDFVTQKPIKLLERIVKASCPRHGLVADFFAGSGTSLEAAERSGCRWLGCELGKVGIQTTRARLVTTDSGPFLIENIGNYQREMIYLSGGRIHEMMAVVLKLYGATPRKGTPELGTRKAPDDVTELVYVGYPDRPTTARKVEELARQADKLDGTGYKRLVVLAWDYDYNFSTELEKRLKSSSQKVRTHIELRTIPPEIYEYLKKAKDEEEIEPLRGKIRFHEKPYLRLAPPQQAQGQRWQNPCRHLHLPLRSV